MLVGRVTCLPFQMRKIRNHGSDPQGELRAHRVGKNTSMGNEGQNPSPGGKAIRLIITGVLGSVLSGSKRTDYGYKTKRCSRPQIKITQNNLFSTVTLA